jgi:hypothetical protein
MTIRANCRYPAERRGAASRNALSIAHNSIVIGFGGPEAAAIIASGASETSGLSLLA